MQEAQIARAGAALRAVPGVRFALDARLAVRDRRWRRAAKRREAELTERDRVLVASLSGRTDLRINVGSSGEHVESWINADLVRDPAGRCLRMDATQPWPFEDGSAEAINSEHMIEHLDRAGARAFVREAFRVLKPGGVIRTSTPDLRAICQAYLHASPEVLDAHRAHGYEADDHADLVNNYVHMHGHRHIYDFESLARELRAAGFEQVERVDFGQSSHPALRGIDRHDAGELQWLVVGADAVKPAAAGGYPHAP